MKNLKFPNIFSASTVLQIPEALFTISGILLFHVRERRNNRENAASCEVKKPPDVVVVVSRHRALFFSAFKWVTVDCEPHGIGGGGGADEQVRRERQDTGRIEGTRHANPSSRCQQPTLYTHTRPGLGRIVCARYTAENMHREQRVERKREGERQREREKDTFERRWRYTERGGEGGRG